VKCEWHRMSLMCIAAYRLYKQQKKKKKKKKKKKREREREGGSRQASDLPGASWTSFQSLTR